MQVWIAFAFSCKYIDKKSFDDLTEKALEVGKLIGYMMNNPGKFGAND